MERTISDMERTISDMERTISEVAGRINGTYGEVAWTPIRYVNRAYSRSVLAGLYRSARAALVTPLRDGMNLVAKEYIAAQDPNDPGVGKGRGRQRFTAEQRHSLSFQGETGTCPAPPRRL